MLRDCSGSGSGDGGSSLGNAWRALKGGDVVKQLRDLGTESANLSSKGHKFTRGSHGCTAMVGGAW
jgi:hypothetical protein